MRVDINPFYTRASEYIDLDEKFIKLFSPEILNIFNEYNIWGNVNSIRSSPGAGKTTLLKIFTPKILRIIRDRSINDDHYKEIYFKLKELKVYDDTGKIVVASSLLSFNNEYASLDYLDLNEFAKTKLFFSLLNTRIILALLQSVSLVKDLRFPEDLNQINISSSNILNLPSSLINVKGGKDLYEWACLQEEKICREIDSIYALKVDYIENCDPLFALDLFAPSNISVNGELLVDHTLVMLDDVHNLSSSQRGALVKAIVDKRPLVKTWISERLRALTMDEIFSEGSKEGRDISPIVLENFWSNKHQAFERFAKSVANRRVASVMDERQDFSSFLSEELEEDDLEKINHAQLEIQSRVIEKYGKIDKYRNWIQSKDNLSTNSYDQIIQWRSLEILLYRDRNKAQKTLDFGELDQEDLEDQEGTDVKTAARLFLHKEYNIPFFYGISTVSRLASSNIEQFLIIAGQLFEDVLSNSVKRIINTKTRLEITPKRQEEIIKRTVNKKKWAELHHKVPNFNEVKAFLEAIANYCQYETYLPNAWNSPGINGVAISMLERKQLRDIVLGDKKHVYYNLAKIISTCISYNLLDFKLNYRCKGKDWMILYINRMYCAKYNLPLNNGKFKEKSLKILLTWLNKGFKVPSQKQIEL